jgi:hypothetical protein
MRFAFWLRNWKRAVSMARRRAQTSVCQRADVRPRLEALEERWLLSTYTVASLTDTGTGSGLTGDLRYCINNATSGNDTITFAQGLTGAIQLHSTLALDASVAIQGPGANLLTVEPDYAPGNVSLFGPLFAVGSTASVAISGLTIYGKNDITGDLGEGALANDGTLTVNACIFSDNSNRDYFGNGGGGAISNYGTATLSNSTFNGNSGIDGGAIFNSGVLALNGSTIEANSVHAATNVKALGGAIFNQGALTINNSTLTANSAQGGPAGFGSGSSSDSPGHFAGKGMGGGIYMSDGTLTINSSTLSDNRAHGGDAGSMYLEPGDGYGGGLYIAGGTVSINNSTLADNQAIFGVFTPGIASGNSYGGGIYNAAGPSALEMYDTIVADNSAHSAGPDLDGSVTSLGHNLIGNSTGGSGFAASDLVNVNPRLGPLQNNGGPTQTRALIAGSPAIDAGDNANAPVYDQRGPGFERVVNGTIDIGALEAENGGATQAGNLAISGFPSSIKAGVFDNFTVTALNADGTIDINYAGKVHFTSSDAQATLPADYTFGAIDAGKHTFSATLFTADTQSLTATDTTTTGITGSEAGISVKPAAASTMTITGFPSTTIAGVAHNFTVTLKDAYGNIATGYTGKVHFTSTDARATLPADYTYTAADAGVHIFSATLKTAGTRSITAADKRVSALKSTQGGITVKAAAASQFMISAPSSVRAGVAFSLTLTVEDAYGNVVTGYTGTVHLSNTDNQATLPSDYTFKTTDSGVHTFTGLVLRKKGTQRITITDTLRSLLTANVTESVH